MLDLTAAPAKEALQFWVDFVQKGSASRDVVNWNQGNVPEQFRSGRAAMMVIGPWMLGQVHKSGVDFGDSACPVPKAGMKPIVPLGGEVWCVSKTDEKTEAAAVKFITFVQDPARLEKICNTFNYISSVKSVAVKQGQANAELQPFVLQMDTARARPEEGGANYPAISLAARTAIQKALTGTIQRGRGPIRSSRENQNRRRKEVINNTNSARLRNADCELRNTRSKVQDLLTAICSARNASRSDAGGYLSFHLSLRRE